MKYSNKIGHTCYANSKYIKKKRKIIKQTSLIRTLDIIFSLTALMILSPLFLILSITIIIESKGGIFYTQKRVGQYNHDFNLFKFRSMYINSDTKGLLTIGKKDARITNSGYFLRKYKLDELPQLINVLKGDMSIVGPRPEVRKYVELYTNKQKQILKLKPGITDLASISYINESEILSKSDEPEQLYINEIMPAKIELNMAYINNKNLKNYFKIVFQTVIKVLINK